MSKAGDGSVSRQTVVYVFPRCVVRGADHERVVALREGVDYPGRRQGKRKIGCR